MRVCEGEAAVVAGDGAQLGGPVGVGGVAFELGQDGLGDAVEQGRLACPNPTGRPGGTPTAAGLAGVGRGYHLM